MIRECRRSFNCATCSVVMSVASPAPRPWAEGHTHVKKQPSHSPATRPTGILTRCATTHRARTSLATARPAARRRVFRQAVPPATHLASLATPPKIELNLCGGCAGTEGRCAHGPAPLAAGRLQAPWSTRSPRWCLRRPRQSFFFSGGQPPDSAKPPSAALLTFQAPLGQSRTQLHIASSPHFQLDRRRTSPRHGRRAFTKRRGRAAYRHHYRSCFIRRWRGAGRRLAREHGHLHFQ